MSPALVAAVLVCSVVTAIRLRRPGPVGLGFVIAVFALGALSGAIAVLN